MNVTVEFLLQVIGTKEVEVQQLHLQIAQLKAELEQFKAATAPTTKVQ